MGKKKKFVLCDGNILCHGYTIDSPYPGGHFDPHMDDIVIYNSYKKSAEGIKITIQLNNAPGTKSHTNYKLSCVSRRKSLRMYAWKIGNINPHKTMQHFSPLIIYLIKIGALISFQRYFWLMIL